MLNISAEIGNCILKRINYKQSYFHREGGHPESFTKEETNACKFNLKLPHLCGGIHGCLAIAPIDDMNEKFYFDRIHDELAQLCNLAAFAIVNLSTDGATAAEFEGCEIERLFVKIISHAPTKVFIC